MTDRQIIIIVKETLISKGLVHCLRTLYPDAPIEEYASWQYLPEKACRDPKIFLIDPMLLDTPRHITLERIYSKTDRCKFIAICKTPPDDNLLPFFDAVIPLDTDEKTILSLLKNAIGSPGNRVPLTPNTLISEREKEVLRGVALGRTNREISNDLHISAHTVITHRKNISAKLGIRTIAGLAVYAVLNSIVSPEEMEGEQDQ